jgi:hypothetical protein
LAEDLNGAGAGREQAGKHLDGGGFACAIGTEEAKKLARFDRKIDVIDRGEAVEPTGELVCEYCWGHDCRVYDSRANEWQ